MKNNKIEMRKWKTPFNIFPTKLKRFENPFPIIKNREPKSTSSSLLFGFVDIMIYYIVFIIFIEFLKKFALIFFE